MTDFTPWSELSRWGRFKRAMFSDHNRIWWEFIAPALAVVIGIPALALILYVLER
jgi:hypothetical protein